LRSAACSAVLCWPQEADDRALRRLQVAAETGQCLGFAMGPLRAAANPSPAALRIAVEADPAQLRVLKCRGGNPPPRPLPLPAPARRVQCGRPMLWACILLPQLALDGVLRRHPDPAAPLALVDGPAQRRVLRAVNPAARAAGLRPGQSLGAAQALCSRFAAVSHDPAEVERWHDFLAAWAYRYSSLVCRTLPSALLLEVEASFKLFGPWPRFEARLREDLAALGFRHRITLAPNPWAARVLANVHDGLAVTAEAPLRNALGQLPVERSGLEPAVAASLRRMGLRRLRQVFALPRAALGKRI